jgi:hypothetical protein
MHHANTIEEKFAETQHKDTCNAVLAGMIRGDQEPLWCSSLESLQPEMSAGQVIEHGAYTQAMRSRYSVFSPKTFALR